MKEHRKSERFQAPKGAFVAIGPAYDQVGPLTDLSTDGLAFQCLGSGEPTKESYVDVFMGDGDSFFLGKLPIETVSYVETPEKGPSWSIITRRCSVKFTKLTPDQEGKLKDFISSWDR